MTECVQYIDDGLCYSFKDAERLIWLKACLNLHTVQTNLCDSINHLATELISQTTHELPCVV